MSEWSSIFKMVTFPVIMLGALTLIPKMLMLGKSELSGVDPQLAPAHDSAPPPAHSTDWTTVIDIGAAVIVVVVAIAVAVAFIWWRLQRHHERTRQRQTQLDRWARAVSALNETCTALAEFETDPESIYFTRPLLADVTEPASAAFYTALAAAQDLHTENAPLDDDTITAFAAAAAAARRAFDTADANARRKARNGIIRSEHGDHTLSISERRKVSQARKLLAQAVDGSATPQFARTAHDKALSLLAEVGVDIPQRLVIKVTDALETSRRLALTRN